ncbi:uncharacterized protein LOC143021854 [Oratosquilla oratoria]|uniref:uncharacterized protein LOC143021854 n=1 Tax=Oratosquilla oratoria TaxID=337810 RepID=UPI003F76813E
MDKEISARICKTSQTLGWLRTRVLNQRNVKLSTKLKMYRAVVLSNILYGRESWTLYSRHLKKIEHFHMRSLRSILNIKWQNRVTNLEVFDREEMISIETMIIKSQLRCVGHVIQMDDHCLPKQLLYGELSSGKRNTGRPRKRFKNCVKTHLTHTNIPPKKA